MHIIPLAHHPQLLQTPRDGVPYNNNKAMIRKSACYGVRRTSTHPEWLDHWHVVGEALRDLAL